MYNHTETPTQNLDAPSIWRPWTFLAPPHTVPLIRPLADGTTAVVTHDSLLPAAVVWCHLDAKLPTERDASLTPPRALLPQRTHGALGEGMTELEVHQRTTSLRMHPPLGPLPRTTRWLGGARTGRREGCRR